MNYDLADEVCLECEQVSLAGAGACAGESGACVVESGALVPSAGLPGRRGAAARSGGWWVMLAAPAAVGGGAMAAFGGAETYLAWGVPPVALVLAGVFGFAERWSRPGRDEDVPERAGVSREAADGRLARVELAYGAYECSLLETFTKPALTLLSVPATREFHVALRAAQDARDALASGRSGGDAETYDALAREAEVRWDAAWQHACLVGTGAVGSAGRVRRMNRAVKLLRQAIDEAATERERDGFLRAAVREVQGLVEVRPQAVAAVPGGLRALEAGPA